MEFENATQSLPVWETVITTHLVGIVLNVSFIPADERYNYSLYRVTVWKAYNGSCSTEIGNDWHLEKCTVKEQEVKTTAVFRTIRLKKSQEYCAKVIPVKNTEEGTCQNGCMPISSPLFKGNYDEEEYCENWTGGIQVVSQAVLKRIDLVLNISETYKQCYTAYVFALSTQPDCSLLPHKEDIVEKQAVIMNGVRVHGIFREVRPGNYCVIVYPEESDCDVIVCQGDDEHSCPFTYTTASMPDIKSSGLPAVSSTVDRMDSPGLSTWLIPLLISAVVVCSCCTGLVVIWRRHRRSVLRIDGKTGNINLPALKKDVQVFLLYSHDSPQHKNLVYLFAQFLRECFGVKVVLDVEQLYLIGINKEMWLTNSLQTNCSAREVGVDDVSGLDKKVIIVESTRAVAEHNERLQGKVRDDYQHPLEELFITGLSLLMADMDKCISDYCHLFVVRFPHTPQDCRLSYLVPNQRYVIPDHLVELHNALYGVQPNGNVDELNVENGKLEDRWSRRMTYHTLLLEIKAAGELTEKKQIT